MSDNHVAALQKMLAQTPDYEGDDPRANYYRYRREALTAAIAALSTRPEPQGDGAAFLGSNRMDLEAIERWRSGGFGHELAANRTSVMRFIGTIDALHAEVAALRRPAQSWQELRTTPPEPMDASGFADSGL